MTIPKQPYTTEFKELSVKRVKEGYSAGAVAKELGLIEQPHTIFWPSTGSMCSRPIGSSRPSRVAFKLLEEAETPWCRIRGADKIGVLLSGVPLKDGIEAQDNPPEQQKLAA